MSFEGRYESYEAYSVCSKCLYGCGSFCVILVTNCSGYIALNLQWNILSTSLIQSLYVFPATGMWHIINKKSVVYFLASGRDAESDEFIELISMGVTALCHQHITGTNCAKMVCVRNRLDQTISLMETVPCGKLLF